MFRRSGEAEGAASGSLDRVDSVIAAGLSWAGSVTGRGGLRIEGAFDGDIELDGLVVVGREGRVTCEKIEAVTVVVSGSVRGDITADRIEIMATGRVWGNVITTSLSTEEGAFLRGQIQMEEALEHSFKGRTETQEEAATEREEGG